MSRRRNKLIFIPSSTLPLIILISVLLQTNPTTSSEFSPPRIKIKEFVWNSSEVIQIYEKTPNTVLIAGEDLGNGTRIQLECTAEYPVQWIFQGDGMPEFSSNTTSVWEAGRIKNSGENETEVIEAPSEFFAVINIGLKQLPNEYDTGNYSCTGIQSPHLSSYYFLYVPGSQLFTSQGGRNISYSRNAKNLRIPCSVSHPNTTVTLQKLHNGLVQCPLNDSVSFDPKSGFNLKVDHLSNLEGDYVCTGSWNKTLFRVIEFTVQLQDAEDGEMVEIEEIEEGTTDANGEKDEEEVDENEIYISSPPPTFSPPPSSQVPSGPTLLNPTTTISSNSGSSSSGSSTTNSYYTSTSSSNPRPTESLHESECSRMRCGINAFCESYRGSPMCKCIPNHKGNPYVECFAKQNSDVIQSPVSEPCIKSRDCEESQMCKKGQCIEACQSGICGINSMCEVVNHIPQCRCPMNMIGDPYKKCRNISEIITPEPTKPNEPNPCNPSPCGNHSTCRLINDVISCQCKPRASGSPPNCQPECTEDRDCPISRGCINNLCENPCDESESNPCGPNAFCQVVGQKRVCTCRHGFFGNAYDLSRGCFQSLKGTQDPLLRSCSIFNHTPCGKNASCVWDPTGGKVKCECLNGLKGDPNKECFSSDEPSLGDICQDHYDCPLELACFTDKRVCADPCEFTKCPARHRCIVNNHRPSCFNRTHEEKGVVRLDDKIEPKLIDVCKPFPCGNNSQCLEIDGKATCKCLLGFRGENASLGCERANCTLDTDCEDSESCIKDFCDDACYYHDCGPFAENCKTKDHRPICSCSDSKGFFGNVCFNRPSEENIIQTEGLNGNILVEPEKGVKISVQVSPGNIGGGGIRDQQIVYDTDRENLLQREVEKDLCNPNPCSGLNAVCKQIGQSWECLCPPFSRGDPYLGCEFEQCYKSTDCPPGLYCNPFTKSCNDPCTIKGVCGSGAMCTVNKNIPSCFCPPGTTGDPFEYCNPIKEMKTEDMLIKEEPENCTIDSDCPLEKSCFYGRSGRKCQSPCQYLKCGIDAECRVKRHKSQCFCKENEYTGDPLTQCFPIPKSKEGAPLHKMVCSSNDTDSCGYNAECQNSGTERAFCKCKEGYVGNPYIICREAIDCLYDFHCSSNRHCVKDKCLDPCAQVGVCGVNQVCKSEAHKHVCDCSPGYIWKLGNCFPSSAIDSLKTYMNLPKSEYFYPEDVYTSDSNKDDPEDVKNDTESRKRSHFRRYLF